MAAARFARPATVRLENVPLSDSAGGGLRSMTLVMYCSSLLLLTVAIGGGRDAASEADRFWPAILDLSKERKLFCSRACMVFSAAAGVEPGG